MLHGFVSYAVLYSLALYMHCYVAFYIYITGTVFALALIAKTYCVLDEDYVT